MAKRKINNAAAAALAAKIIAALEPACERIEVAGSLRRGAELVGDIELLAIPKFGMRAGAGLWSEPGNLLEPLLEGLVRDQKLYPVKRGDKAHQYQVMTLRPPVQLDLFMVDAAGWGYQLAIRTGPSDYSRWLVTQRHRGGPLQYGFICRDGHVWRLISGMNDVEGEVRDIDGSPHVLHPTPEETDFFKLIQGGYVPPEKRKAR